MNHIKKIILSLAILLIVGLIGLLIFKPWSFVENYELGYRFNKLTGEITVVNHTGYVGKKPIVESIHTIDLRPRQVCINVGYPSGQNSGASDINRRVLNCKLVEFDPKGLALFLSWHGRGDYSGDDFNDLLKIYAYDGSGRNYPFLRIRSEVKAEPVQAAQ